MATEKTTNPQSLTEIRTHFVDFTDDLPAGVTVSTAAAAHTPPSGSASTPTVGAISGAVVPVTLGPLTVAGRHVLTVTATLSNADLSVMRLVIPVEWETARAGMVDLIADLRGMTDTGSNDYTIGGRPYWTDRQLEDVLDRCRVDHYRADLAPVLTYEGAGTIVYKNYYTGVNNIERTTDGTAIFRIEDATGAVIGTASYSMDYRVGHAVFGADTDGSVYLWTGRSYDLDRAAALVWRQKAAHYTTAFSFTTDNHRVDKGAIYKQCLQMAEYYEQRSSTPQVVTMYRSDAAC